MKRSITPRTLLASAVLLAVLVAVGCQTVKGLGKDIENASEATEEALFK